MQWHPGDSPIPGYQSGAVSGVADISRGCLKIIGERQNVSQTVITDQRPVSQKISSPLVILSMEKTMVTMVISELKSVSRLKIFPETGPR